MVARPVSGANRAACHSGLAGAKLIIGGVRLDSVRLFRALIVAARRSPADTISSISARTNLSLCNRLRLFSAPAFTHKPCRRRRAQTPVLAINPQPNPPAPASKYPPMRVQCGSLLLPAELIGKAPSKDWKCIPCFSPLVSHFAWAQPLARRTISMLKAKNSRAGTYSLPPERECGQTDLFHGFCMLKRHQFTTTRPGGASKLIQPAWYACV